MTTPPCAAHENCPDPAVVGWGDPPVWMCQRGFDEHLAEVRSKINNLYGKLMS